MKLALVTLATLAGTVPSNPTGDYNATGGFAETLAVSPTEQLGQFRLVLRAQNWGSASVRRIRLKGVIRGVLDPATLTLSHTLVNHDRTGAIFTVGDQITQVFAGDPTCANGSVPFQIEETLNIAAGTGEFANIQPGGWVKVVGTVNNCPGLPGFGRNDFEVTDGFVTFQ